ncbi:glycosyltransferase family 1 protein [Aquimarina aquimarini]|uniref:glycosyltransferase family 1 protein n=1 Tax=Aquimarina aquimarini TaxID=1191734 RepID=UPI000D5597D9|nr:glycosyltransferase family 1 protein [Aquimarina aquimarini]
MKPIRILQVLTIMNRGGAETMVMNYYRNIDRNKVQFDFLLHRQERGVFDDEIESLGGKIHRLQNISFRNLSGYRKALDHFFQHHPEYQIVHSHLNALSTFVLKSAKKQGVKTRIAHSHTSLYNLNLNPFSKNRHSLNFAFRFFAQNMLKKQVPKYANYYYSCGDKAGQWLFGKKNTQKIKIINNAIDSSKFVYDREQSERIKKELQIEDTFVIGHVGNFVPEKNHSFLLEIFKEIQREKKDSVLILVGAGERAQYEQMTSTLGIEKEVHFLGARNDVPDLLQAIDVFLFPSTNEGLPVTLIEAQAAGLKIIASDEISKELDITGMIDFVSLSQSPKYWAELLLKSVNYNRTNTMNKIIEGNYDIKNNATMLQEFYCNQVNK